jgi:hypothetical protein
MTTKKWSEIKAKKFTPEELRQIAQEVQRELREMSGIKLVEG